MKQQAASFIQAFHYKHLYSATSSGGTQ